MQEAKHRLAAVRGYLLPVVIAVLAHGLGLGGEFVADDIPDILQHPVVTGAAPIGEVLDYNYMGAPLGEGANTLRPLATLLFAAEWRLFAGSPFFFHLSSLVWFVLVVVVAHRTLERVVDRGPALAGASIFASLAIHVDAVALIANRPEVCSLLFSLVALGAVLDRRLVLAVICYWIALLFKESAFLLPLVTGGWLAGTSGLSSLRWKDHGKTVLALMAAAIVFLAARTTLLSVDISSTILLADNPLRGQPVSVRLWMPFVLLGEYLTTMLSPVELAFDYTYDAIPVDAGLSRINGWIGLASTAVLTTPIVCRFKRADDAPPWLRVAAAGALGFFAAYALFSNSVFLIVTLFAERLFFTPSFYIVVIGTAMGQAAWQVGLGRFRRSIIAFVAVVIVVQTLHAAVRTRECATERSLLEAQIVAQPDSVKGHLYLARILGRAGEMKRAIWHLGVATLGRNTHPDRFRAPARQFDDIEEDLHRLPALLAPDKDPRTFWPAFRGFVAQSLGPAAAAAVDELLRGHAAVAP